MYELLFVAIIAILLLLLFLFYRKFWSMRDQLLRLQSDKASQSARYGKLTEQWIPFTEQFPYNANDFHFLGNPIDGIVFADDKIVFCEFKAADSQLTQKQRRIRDIIKSKAVEWFEFRIR